MSVPFTYSSQDILHDLRASTDHDGFWLRFSQSPERSGWYYGRLERALGARLAGQDGSEMVEELRHALDAIGGLPGCSAFAAGIDGGRAGGECPAKPAGPDCATT